MRTTGIFLVLAGAAMIVFYVLYEVLQAVIRVPFPVKAGFGLLLLGAILFVIGVIRDRMRYSRNKPVPKRGWG
ncbi:MAG: hypothetical protein ACE5LH_09250, partial [Fidelibacterota bacterium]